MQLMDASLAGLLSCSATVLISMHVLPTNFLAVLKYLVGFTPGQSAG